MLWIVAYFSCVLSLHETTLSGYRMNVKFESVVSLGSNERILSRSSDSSSSRARRSSIVVIPPMQICPGDLLVYSKVLTHRNNLLGKSMCSMEKTLLPSIVWTLTNAHMYIYKTLKSVQHVQHEDVPFVYSRDYV
jgi:hypothetical protein